MHQLRKDVDTVSTLDWMSWIIAGCNNSSVILTGIATVLVIRKRPNWKVWMAISWCVLLIGQVTFWLFGFKSGYPGFKYLQPGMIPGSLANLLIATSLRKRLERSSAETPPDTGRIYISHTDNLARAAQKQVELGPATPGACDAGTCRHSYHTAKHGFVRGSGWERRA